MPKWLHKQTKEMAFAFRTTASQIGRDAIAERVEYLRNRLRLLKEEKREAAKKNGAERTKLKAGRVLGDSPLAPVRKSMAPDEFRPTPADIKEAREQGESDGDGDVDGVDVDESEAIYQQNATRIAEVIDKPAERRVCIEEAIAAVKRQAPLTHPTDAEIRVRLEKLVLSEVARLDAEAAAKKAEAAQELEERRQFRAEMDARREAEAQVIDPTRMRTAGSVPHE